MSQSVFITGVSSGIGHGLAKAYLSRGWSVLACSRRAPSPEMPAKRFRFESIDVTDSSAVSTGLRELFASEAAVDTAILNAGTLGTLGDLTETPLDDLRETMEVNVWSNKRLLDELLLSQRVKRQVVTISSAASINGNRGFGGYSISKAALNMLTRLYAREYPDLHFCALAPGVIVTQMQEALSRKAEDDRFETFRQLRDRRLAGEMQTPETAAEALIDAIERLPILVDSGDYADIREERFHDACPRG